MSNRAVGGVEELITEVREERKDLQMRAPILLRQGYARQINADERSGRGLKPENSTCGAPAFA